MTGLPPNHSGMVVFSKGSHEVWCYHFAFLRLQPVSIHQASRSGDHIGPQDSMKIQEALRRVPKKVFMKTKMLMRKRRAARDTREASAK